MIDSAPTSGLTHTDIAIIGAGPVGLFTVFQAGMLNMRAHVFDCLDQIGGQCSTLYPQKPIYDIPAYPSISGAELINNLAAQCAPFEPQYHLGHSIEQITQDPSGGFVVTTSAKLSIHAKYVVIAGGSGVFAPTRPSLPNIEHYEKKSVFYHVADTQKFADKRVVIAGGGDSAVDWAIELSDIAKKIYMIHRRNHFRAAPESVARMEEKCRQGKIELVVPYQLAELSGADGQLTSVSVATLDGDTLILEADALLPLFGLITNIGPIAEWGLNIQDGGIAVDQETCSTNIEGIYAVGDIARYPSKLKLILSGFAEAAAAIHHAYLNSHPGELIQWEHSTTRGIG